MAGILNSYFSQSSHKKMLVTFHQQSSFTFVLCDTKKVQKKLEDLKPESTPGPGGVWPQVLQKLASVLALDLALIFTRLFHFRKVHCLQYGKNQMSVQFTRRGQMEALCHL